MSTDKTKTNDQGDDGDRILPLQQIQIDGVFDNDKVRITSPLVGCFFSPAGGGVYMLFGQQGGPVQGGRQIRDGEPFTIVFAGSQWDLTVCFSDDDKKAHGTWGPHRGGDGDDDGTGDVDGDGGTYTAQAGGGVLNAVAASA